MIGKIVIAILVYASIFQETVGYSAHGRQVKDTLFILIPDKITQGSMAKLSLPDTTKTGYSFINVPEYGNKYPGFWLILDNKPYQTLSHKAFNRFDRKILNIPAVADSIGKNPGFVYSHQLIGIKKVNKKYDFYHVKGIDLRSTHPEEE